MKYNYRVVKRGESENFEELFLGAAKNVYKKSDTPFIPKIEEQKIAHVFSSQFKTSELETELFIVLDGEEPVARSMAIADNSNNKFLGGNTGFFNYFECINSKNAAKFLFDQMINWYKAKSFSEIIGPMSPNLTESRGVALDHRSRPVFGMPHNPLYYDYLLRDCGFIKIKDLYELIVKMDRDFHRIEKLANFVKSKNPSIVVRRINLNQIEKEISSIVKIYNKAWCNNWGFIPTSVKDLLNAGENLFGLLQHSMIVEDSGKPVGFHMILPDINKLYPDTTNYIEATCLEEIRSYRALFIGVLPEYRMQGIEILLFNEVVNRDPLKAVVDEFHVSWVLEDNIKLLKEFASIFSEESIAKRKYRLYNTTMRGR